MCPPGRPRGQGRGRPRGQGRPEGLHLWLWMVLVLSGLYRLHRKYYSRNKNNNFLQCFSSPHSPIRASKQCHLK